MQRDEKKMKKTALIQPYFGKFPDYFPPFLYALLQYNLGRVIS